MLIDTHCHIHEPDYPLGIKDVMDRAFEADVRQMICVGTDEKSSRIAVQFAAAHSGVMFSSVGVHPHEAKNGWDEIETIVNDKPAGLVAVGEIGLDYHYDYSPRDVQIEALQTQIELGLKHDLPIIFHVREGFEDFWPIIDNFNEIRGVLHSFTDDPVHADEALKRGLYIGVNGYSTFTKNGSQQRMYATLPLDRLLMETDAPFLTPAPFRGKVNEPAFVRNVAMHQSLVRGISVDEVADQTTANARVLFGL